MSTEEALQNKRITLGPEVSNFVRSLPGESAGELDNAFKVLIETRDRAAFLERQAVSNADVVSRLVEINSQLSAALTTTSESVTELTNMVDHRTREFEKLLLHISGLVGVHMTDGEESERLHRRLAEIETDFAKQMSSLTTLVQQQQQRRTSQVQNTVGRAEEERLTIAEQEHALAKRQPERGGMER